MTNYTTFLWKCILYILNNLIFLFIVQLNHSSDHYLAGVSQDHVRVWISWLCPALLFNVLIMTYPGLFLPPGYFTCAMDYVVDCQVAPAKFTHLSLLYFELSIFCQIILFSVELTVASLK